MPIFAVMGIDVPAGYNIRDANKAEHRAYVSADVSHIRLAGALVDDEDRQCGTLYLIEADTIEAVKAWLASEPFIHAGTYETLAIRRITLNPPWATPEAPPADALARLLGN